MADRDTLKDRAYSHLRDAIVTGELADGSRHSIYRLSEELGISRTPIREAVLQLAETGLVSIERNRGIVIHGLSVDDIRQIFEMRLLLEVPAAAHAATHGDDAFLERLRQTTAAMEHSATANDAEAFRLHDRALHDAIAAELENARLSSTLRGLRDVTTAYGAWTGDGPRDAAAILHEHAPIVDAIVARRPDDAAAAMEAHLLRTAELLMRQVSARTGEPITWARLAPPNARRGAPEGTPSSRARGGT